MKIGNGVRPCVCLQHSSRFSSPHGHRWSMWNTSSTRRLTVSRLLALWTESMIHPSDVLSPRKPQGGDGRGGRELYCQVPRSSGNNRPPDPPGRFSWKTRQQVFLLRLQKHLFCVPPHLALRFAETKQPLPRDTRAGVVARLSRSAARSSTSASRPGDGPLR